MQFLIVMHYRWELQKFTGYDLNQTNVPFIVNIYAAHNKKKKRMRASATGDFFLIICLGAGFISIWSRFNKHAMVQNHGDFPTAATTAKFMFVCSIQ